MLDPNRAEKFGLSENLVAKFKVLNNFGNIFEYFLLLFEKIIIAANFEYCKRYITIINFDFVSK